MAKLSALQPRSVVRAGGSAETVVGATQSERMLLVLRETLAATRGEFEPVSLGIYCKNRSRGSTSIGSSLQQQEQRVYHPDTTGTQ